MSTLVSLTEQALCTSDDGDGCARSFEFKTSRGLCAKCQKLAVLRAEGSTELAAFKLFAQCDGCGAAWRNFEGGLCGTCAVKKATAQSASQGADARAVPVSESEEPEEPTVTRVSAVIQASQNHRAEATAVRLKRNVPAPTPPLNTTAGLDRARHGGGPPNSEKVMISMAVRIRTASKREAQNTDASYGSFAMAWAKSAYMSEVLDEALENANRTWLKTETLRLTRDDTELRFAGNKTMWNGAQNSTVGQVYQQYMCGDLGTYYGAQTGSKRVTGGKAGNLPTMPLELYIDKLAHLKRIDSNDAGNTVVTRNARGSKRAHPHIDLSDSDHEEDRTKRVKHPGPPLLSLFTRTTGLRASKDSQACDIVEFIRAHCTCAVETGEVDIMWPEDDGFERAERGFLCREIFARGATKNIYKLSIGEKTYVAKRFINIGSDTEVTAEENATALQAELVRLTQGRWFLKRFFEATRKVNIECYNDVEFSPGLLMREIGFPSSASGCKATDSAVWLVEPLRTKSFDKFTGTLQHPNPRNLRDMTFAAFTHFTYETSMREMVFADLQGSPMVVNNRDGHVLFDPMTHTPEGDSGVGDHGQAGIDAFAEQHQCNHICDALGLSQSEESVPDGADAEEGEESDSD